MKVQKNRITAFSLFELSIVLILIGLLIASLTIGRHLVVKYKVSSTLIEQEEYMKALNTFRGIYDAFPGDMPNISVYEPKAMDCENSEDNPIVVNTVCDDELIGFDTPDELESALFFQNLSATKVLKGVKYTGEKPTSFEDVKVGVNFPVSKLGKDKYYFIQSGTLGGLFRRSNRISVGSNTSQGGGISSNSAMLMDDKIDDGNPLTGNILGLNLQDGVVVKNQYFNLVKNAYASTNCNSLSIPLHTSTHEQRESAEYNDDVECLVTNSKYTIPLVAQEEVLNNPIEPPSGCSNANLASPVDYGRWVGETAQHNKSLSASCNYGGLGGTLTCNDGSWASNVSCNPPSDCSGATIAQSLSYGSWASESAESGSSVAANCDNGHGTIVPRLNCDNGNWAYNGANCNESTSCSNASGFLALNNGSWSSETANHLSSVTANCTYSGSGSLSCNNGSWSGSGSCDAAVNCSNASGFLALNNGSWSSESADHQGNVTANCDLSGSGSLSCNNGSWSGSGSCDAAVNCSNASGFLALNNGSWSSESADHQGNVTANCDFSGSGSLSCNNGSWSGSGSCDAAVNCSNASGFLALNNGSWSSESADHQGNVTANCNFSGSGSLSCNNGSWSGSGSCNTPSSCNAGKPSLPNGSWPSGSRVHGKYSNGNCPHGKSGGTPRITCDNGSWIRTGGNCKAPALSCNSGKPSLPNGSWPGGSRSHGQSFNGNCSYGSSGGTPRITCNNGSWRRSGGNCKAQTLCFAYTGPRVYSKKKSKYKQYRVTSNATYGQCKTIQKYSSKKRRWKNSGYNRCCGSSSNPRWKYGKTSKGSKRCPSC